MITSITLGFCTDMTAACAKFYPVVTVKLSHGKLDWQMISAVPLDAVSKEVLYSTKKRCSSLEEVRDVFSSPHSSIQVVEIERA